LAVRAKVPGNESSWKQKLHL